MCQCPKCGSEEVASRDYDEDFEQYLLENNEELFDSEHSTE